MSEVEKHFERCRLCLMSVLDDDCKTNISENIMKKIRLINITIIDSKCYSSFVCRLCVMNLENISTFRNKIMKQQKKLTLYLCRIKEWIKEVDKHSMEIAPVIKSEVLESVIIKEEPCEEEEPCDSHPTDFCFNDNSSTSSISHKSLERQSIVPEINVPETKQPCALCGKVLSRTAMNNHLKRLHYKLKTISCDMCGKSFVNKQDLTFHIISHIPKHLRVRHHECIICHRKFDSSKSLSNHKKYHHGTKKTGKKDDEQLKEPCKFCGKVLSKSTIQYHYKRIHSKGRKFWCDKCGKSYNIKQDLMFHVTNHIPKKYRSYDFKCDICSRKFDSKRNLGTHKRNVHLNNDLNKKPCEYCGKMINKRSLIQHYKHMHEETHENICDVCGKGFPFKRGLRLHMISHVPKEKRNYDQKCEICLKMFHDLSSLKFHIKYHHPKPNEICTCHICGKTFSRMVEMKKHIKRTHGPKNENIKNLICNICGNLFSQMDHLRQHKRRQHGEKKIICDSPGCGKLFFSKSALERHKKVVHLNIREHLCPNCGKGFSRKDLLKQHVLFFHENYRLKCTLCEYKVGRSDKMRVHFRQVHKLPNEDMEKHLDEIKKIGLIKY